MKTFSCVAALLVTGLAHAAGSTSCEQAQQAIARRALTCPVENAQVQAIRCEDSKSYTQARLTELMDACTSRERAAAKERRKAAGIVRMAKCKAFDLKGKPLIEHSTDDGHITCGEELTEKVAAMKCGPSDPHISFQIAYEAKGVDPAPKKRVAACKPKK